MTSQIVIIPFLDAKQSSHSFYEIGQPWQLGEYVTGSIMASGKS